MSSILYIGNDYCYTLEQLQDYFRHISSDQDVLYNELLTLQRDGLIVQWLEEGTETEKALAKRIKGLTKNLTNKEVMENLAEILTNKNKNFNVNFLSYLELKEVTYALTEFKQMDVAFKSIRNGDVINMMEEHLNGTMHLRLKFKILKREKESFNLKATLSLHQQVIHEETSCLHLNNELSGKERLLDFCIPAHKLPKGLYTYMLEVKSESQVLFSAKVSLGIPVIFTLNGVRFKMIKVEGGTFKMGSPNNDSDSYKDERPQHDVTLKDFYIGETVVTQALWKSVMKRNPSVFTGEDELPVERVSYDGITGFLVKLNDKLKDLQHVMKEYELPVENVSYNDITGFLAQLNDKLKDQLHGMKFALPTEEQWEFAARGGVKSKGYKYSGSNDISQVAWYDDNSNHRPHPVRKMAPNELGIYDMSGNVWELCDSYWRSNYNTNPDSSRRVIRGGSWYNCAIACRVARRWDSSPDYRVGYIGFRLVLQ